MFFNLIIMNSELDGIICRYFKWGSVKNKRSSELSSVPPLCLTLWPHGPQHARLLCPSPTPGTCSNSCPSSWWCHPTILSSVVYWYSLIKPNAGNNLKPQSQCHLIYFTCLMISSLFIQHKQTCMHITGKKKLSLYLHNGVIFVLLINQHEPNV